jgi:hypothetical protein
MLIVLGARAACWAPAEGGAAAVMLCHSLCTLPSDCESRDATLVWCWQPAAACWAPAEGAAAAVTVGFVLPAGHLQKVQQLQLRLGLCCLLGTCRRCSSSSSFCCLLGTCRRCSTAESACHLMVQHCSFSMSYYAAAAMTVCGVAWCDGASWFACHLCCKRL